MQSTSTTTRDTRDPRETRESERTGYGYTGESRREGERREGESERERERREYESERREGSDRRRYESSPTSTHQVESTVLDAPIGVVYDIWRTFNFEKYLPTHIKSTRFTCGSPNEIGSTFEIEFRDGKSWTYRIVELSEVRREISYELISTRPQVPFTSLLHTVRFCSVTTEGSTFVHWRTEYSSDVDVEQLTAGRRRRLDYFEDLRKYLTSSGTSSSSSRRDREREGERDRD